MTTTPAGLASRNNSNPLLRAILFALMNNGAQGLSDPMNSEMLLRAILYQLTIGGAAPGRSSSSSVFASSIAEAQAKPSAQVPLGNLVFIMNAVATGQLSAYRLDNGTPTLPSPNQFQPTDNPNLTYTIAL